MTQERRTRRRRAPQGQPDAVVVGQPTETEVPATPGVVSRPLDVEGTVTVNIEVSASIAGPEADHPHYTLGQWRGYTQYKCKRCAYDTLNKETAEQHAQEHVHDTSAVERDRRKRLGIAVANSSGHVIGEV